MPQIICLLWHPGNPCYRVIMDPSIIKQLALIALYSIDSIDSIIYIYIYIYIYYKVFTILNLKQPNSWELILAVYKYSRRLLARTLSPKVLSNKLLVWFSYDWLTHSQILFFLNLILRNFILVWKSNSSVFKVLNFIRILCAKLTMCEWICAFQIQKVA